MGKPLKILVCGDVKGKLNQLFKKINTVNSKNGPFDMLICLGEFFDPNNEEEWLPYKEGRIIVPISTYILGPIKKENKKFFHDLRGCEVAENIVYLGPNGIYPCSNGLKMAYLSGCQNPCESLGSTFGIDAIKSLVMAAGAKPKIDLLITSEWPRGVYNFANTPTDLPSQNYGSLLISRLAFQLKPRYHFSGLANVHYERLPYRNHQVLKESAHHVTRFISLANVANETKKKWLYAINLVPICHLESTELVKQPSDVTESPYSTSIVVDTESAFVTKKQTKSNQFFYDTESSAKDLERQSTKRNHDGGPKMGPPKPKGPCWFCLASSEVEKHLVVSVGTHCYLALAKGGLTPDHLLILPIEHFQSTSDIEKECREEIDQFKTSLEKMFAKNGKIVVFFERNYRTQHMQVQVVPLPKHFLPHIKETFLDVGESSDINLDEIPKHSDIAQLAPPGTPFFYTELPDGKKFYFRIRKGFPLQFGREVLASPPLLNIPDKIDWRECKISKEEETERRNSVRSQFKAFDFTLQDDDDDSSSDESTSSGEE